MFNNSGRSEGSSKAGAEPMTSDVEDWVYLTQDRVHLLQDVRIHTNPCRDYLCGVSSSATYSLLLVISKRRVTSYESEQPRGRPGALLVYGACQNNYFSVKCPTPRTCCTPRISMVRAVQNIVSAKTILSVYLAPNHVRGRGDVEVRLLASHQGDPGSIPSWVTPDFCCPNIEVLRADEGEGRRNELDSRRGRPKIFACGNRAGRCRWSVDFLTSFHRIGSQDLDVKSHPNIFTHSLAWSNRRMSCICRDSQWTMSVVTGWVSARPHTQCPSDSRSVCSKEVAQLGVPGGRRQVPNLGGVPTGCVESLASQHCLPTAFSPRHFTLYIILCLTDKVAGRLAWVCSHVCLRTAFKKRYACVYDFQFLHFSLQPVFVIVKRAQTGIFTAIYSPIVQPAGFSQSQTSLPLVTPSFFCRSEQPLIHSSIPTQLNVWHEKPTAIFIALVVTFWKVQRTPSRAERTRLSRVEWFGQPLTSGSCEAMRAKRDEYGAAPKCEGEANGRSPRKPADQRDRPTLFPRAKIRERPLRESNLAH
ncbi:hypothetical protein PR048_030929 [Dryococelus australis]|uniref:Uncharacterized protein n=1 Tax=Dryococelus australis TaxID=614101 RepID=A0ABQ9GE39_9NEOP|nr:hypothetical protein PR048_030929 [Dryococelus australis]